MGILRNPYPADEMPPAAPGVLAAAIQPKKPGFFDGGGTGSKIASFLLEALSGVPSAAHREQRQERDMALAGQRSMLAQQLEMHKWQQQEAWKRDHPAPLQPTNTERTYQFLKGMNPALAESYITNQATAPPLVVKNSDGTSTVYPSGAIPRTAAPAGPPPGVTFTPLDQPKGGPALSRRSTFP